MGGFVARYVPTVQSFEPMILIPICDTTNSLHMSMLRLAKQSWAKQCDTPVCRSYVEALNYTSLSSEKRVQLNENIAKQVLRNYLHSQFGSQNRGTAAKVFVGSEVERQFR